MAEKVFTAFIEKILKKTRENKIKWKYLDSFDDLYTKMGWADAIIGMPTFDTEKSFFTQIDAYFIVLLTDEKNLTDLYVVPSTYKNICVLKAEEYGEYTTRLYNLVRARFPDAAAFITNFLNENQM